MRKQVNKIRTATIELPISHDHGVPVLQDFLAEVQRRFDVEKDIKNSLYAFILEEGLYEKLKHYELSRGTLSDAKARALAALEINYSHEEEKEAILCMR